MKYSGIGFPASNNSFILACAISRATIKVPFKFKRVLIGYLDNSATISAIGRFKSILTAASKCGGVAGNNRFGLTSNCSTKIPSFVILPLIFLSAEQETPNPTGQEAAWRGKRMTRTS